MTASFHAFAKHKLKIYTRRLIFKFYEILSLANVNNIFQVELSRDLLSSAAIDFAA